VGALVEHESALRASLLAEYGVSLRGALGGTSELTLMDLADLTAHLPPGCALWRATGGEIAWSIEAHLLVRVENDLRVLAWQNTEDGSKGRNRPEPIEPPKSARDRHTEERRVSERAAAYMRRTGQGR